MTSQGPKEESLTQLLTHEKLVIIMKHKPSPSLISPLGKDARTAAARRRAASPAYAALEKKHEVALAIADLVISHRTRAGLTQEVLAERMGTSVSAISRLESGFHVPSIGTLRRLAEALGGRVKIDIVDVAAPMTRPKRLELVKAGKT
jgi:ribosome-binding protein aMBF1 (putative translation factor)